MAFAQAQAEAYMELSGIMAGIADSVNLVTFAVENLWTGMSANIHVIAVDADVPQKPVEIPARFRFEDMDVFTGTGVERFKQEVQSASDMLRQLNATQDAMAKKAYDSPDPSMGGWQELNSMAVRLDLIRERVQKIEGSRLNFGSDAANKELEALRAKLCQAVGEQKTLNKAVNEMDVSAANDAYERLAKTVGGVEQYLRDNVDEQGNFNKAAEDGCARFNELKDKAKKAVSSFVSVQNLGRALDLSDQLAGAAARLNTVNKGAQTTQELMDMVHWAAQDARVSFFDMEKAVTSLGVNADGVFGSSEEMVAFADLVQKQMTMAGMTPEDASGAMEQLAAALGSGTLGERELNGIFAKAPDMIRNIADYLGVSADQVRRIASEGGVSAETVKAAIFAASDDIQTRFEEFPMTWGQVWGQMRQGALGAFDPVLQKLSELANSELVQYFVNDVMAGLSVTAQILGTVLDLVFQVGEFMAANWSVIGPIVYGVAAALLLYAGYLALVKLASLAAAVAQGIMNSALLASPITWIVLLVAALIAILYFAVDKINEVTGSAISATGIIAGVLATLGAQAINTFVLPVWNKIAALVNFFGNCFNDPIAAVQVLFYDMCLAVVGYIRNLASAIENLINKIPGVSIDITGGLDGFYDDLEKAQQKVKDESEWVEYVKKMEYLDYSDAWDAGYAFGGRIEKSVSEMNPFSLFDKLPADEEAKQSLKGIEGGVDNISDSLDCAAEDLKYLRDIAEQEAVNRFTMAEVKVEQTNHNNINSGMDLDGVVSGLTDAVNEAVDNITEGVHT